MSSDRVVLGGMNRAEPRQGKTGRCSIVHPIQPLDRGRREQAEGGRAMGMGYDTVSNE